MYSISSVMMHVRTNIFLDFIFLFLLNFFFFLLTMKRHMTAVT